MATASINLTADLVNRQTHTIRVISPYDRCFYAVSRALNGKPGVIAAMQAIVGAKLDDPAYGGDLQFVCYEYEEA
jgi:hypothetical protein